MLVSSIPYCGMITSVPATAMFSRLKWHSQAKAINSAGSASGCALAVRRGCLRLPSSNAHSTRRSSLNVSVDGGCRVRLESTAYWTS